MNNYIAFVVLVICVSSGRAIIWKDCGSKLAKVVDVQVTGCDKDKACNLLRGENVSITVDFYPNVDVQTAISVVHGNIDRVFLPFPTLEPDACKDPDYGLQCPLKQSESYSFKTYVYISHSYPKVKVVVKWELQNKDGKDIFCVMVPAQIVNAKKKV